MVSRTLIIHYSESRHFKLFVFLRFTMGDNLCVWFFGYTTTTTLLCSLPVSISYVVPVNHQVKEEVKIWFTWRQLVVKDVSKQSRLYLKLPVEMWSFFQDGEKNLI